MDKTRFKVPTWNMAEVEKIGGEIVARWETWDGNQAITVEVEAERVRDIWNQTESRTAFSVFVASNGIEFTAGGNDLRTLDVIRSN